VSELVARLKSRNLATNAATWNAAQREDLGSSAPLQVATPETHAALRELVVEASVLDSPLLFVGGGTALGCGEPLERADLAVSTRGLARVVEHSPADFVIAVEAGMRLADLQRLLAPHRQWLAIEPPDPDRATIGGIVASAATSLVSAAHGTLRGHLLGLRVLHADGRFAKAGGRVVKNVAGYDLMKMHHGALGTLGAVVAATLRLRPLPAADVVAWTSCDDAASIVACSDELARPGLLPAGAHFVGNLGAGAASGSRVEGDLVVRFQGASAAVLDQLGDVESKLAARSPKLPPFRREALEPGERFPRPRALLAIEDACSRGDESGTAHLSLHFRPSRLAAVLEALSKFGHGRVALDLVRGSGFLKLVDGPTASLSGAIASGLRELRVDFSKCDAAAFVHAGPAAIRAALPATTAATGSNGAVTSASIVDRLGQQLRAELDPNGLFHRGRLGRSGAAARS
jgi:FAD/FMN-containing dehydrogenase